MIYKYKDFFNEAKAIHNIKDIYIDKWNIIRHDKSNGIIDNDFIDLFNSKLTYSLFRNIFYTYKSIIMYKDNAYMFRPIELDNPDFNHFINMIKQFNYDYNYFTYSNYNSSEFQTLIENNKTFYNFVDNSISSNLNRTINILLDLAFIYRNNIVLQNMFFNKIFLFKINNINYVLSKGFVDKLKYCKYNGSLYLETNDILYNTNGG